MNVLRIIFFIIFAYIPFAVFPEKYPIYSIKTSIAIVDKEALFKKSEWGISVLNEVERRVKLLADENRNIEKKLMQEELKLTKSRKKIDKLEFDVLSFEFDKKVKLVREVQSSKQTDINIFLNERRNFFSNKITPILLNFINELGVEVLLNKDTVALAYTGSDITNAAIIMINSQLINDSYK
tara:strand:+ start:1048 stop:1593 length:546 start_codon:yes stop_codon:yes gene_type:complete